MILYKSSREGLFSQAYPAQVLFNNFRHYEENNLFTEHHELITFDRVHYLMVQDITKKSYKHSFKEIFTKDFGGDFHKRFQRSYFKEHLKRFKLQ